MVLLVMLHLDYLNGHSKCDDEPECNYLDTDSKIEFTIVFLSYLLLF